MEKQSFYHPNYELFRHDTLAENMPVACRKEWNALWNAVSEYYVHACANSCGRGGSCQSLLAPVDYYDAIFKETAKRS